MLWTVASFSPAYAAGPLLATNSIEGRYEDGVFRLPPLADPRNHYVVLLTVDGKEQPARPLPAGATGAIFGANALPTGIWSWRFALQAAELPPLPVKTNDRLHVPAAVLTAYEGRLLLEWEKVPKASAYQVAIATAKNPPATEGDKWGTDQKVATRCAEPELVNCNLDFGAQAGKRYRWSVTAFDADDIAVARSEPRTIEVAGSTLAAVKEAGWSLQRADSGSEEDAKPALFSYASKQEESTPRASAYSAALAVIWQPKRRVSEWVFPRFSVETRRTSSGEDKEDDATILRAGAFGTSTTRRDDDERRAGYNWTASVKHERARKDGTRKGLAEFRITPFLGPLARYTDFPHVGHDGRNSAGIISVERFPIAQVMPVLSLGAEIGKTFEVGSSAENREKIRRLRGDLRFDVLWPSLSARLGVLSVVTYGGGTYWRLTSQGDEYDLGYAGISIGLTPEISLDVAYKVGEEAPNFKFVRSTNIGVGFKF